MKCLSCGAEIENGEKFCTNCGTPVPQSEEKKEAPEPVKKPERKRHRALSPWGYFGLEFLYIIPVIGLLFLIILSFSRNINVRNFTRSYWCALLVFLIAAIVGAAVLYATGYSGQVINYISELMQSLPKF